MSSVISMQPHKVFPLDVLDNWFKYSTGRTTYTCMTNKDGGAEADITVSVLENGDGSSVIKPKFEGELTERQGNKFKSVMLLISVFDKSYYELIDWVGWSDCKTLFWLKQGAKKTDFPVLAFLTGLTSWPKLKMSKNYLPFRQVMDKMH